MEAVCAWAVDYVEPVENPEGLALTLDFGSVARSMDYLLHILNSLGAPAAVFVVPQVVTAQLLKTQLNRVAPAVALGVIGVYWTVVTVLAVLILGRIAP